MQPDLKNSFRQGDVLGWPVDPNNVFGLADAEEVADDNGRIILAYGEVTGHAHAIADHNPVMLDPETIVANAIMKARGEGRKARLLKVASGDLYLEVTEPVNLTHEEHTPHNLPAQLYELPIQVDFTAGMARQVAD